MLPDGPEQDRYGAAERYGYFAIERLINEVLKHGGLKSRLEIKVFGGGQIMAGMRDIGSSNVAFVRNYLSAEGLSIAAEDVAGRTGRRLRYAPLTGKALVKNLLPVQSGDLLRREREHGERLDVQKTGGVELF